jgi:hypothetical protein
MLKDFEIKMAAFLGPHHMIWSLREEKAAGKICREATRWQK